MKNSALETMTRSVIPVHGALGVKAGLQEICSYTLERCFLKTAPEEMEEGEQLCPFTLEPVCMQTRAMSAGRD
jgi:hypothetical protein